jgi:hypothetical protein
MGHILHYFTSGLESTLASCFLPPTGERCDLCEFLEDRVSRLPRALQGCISRVAGDSPRRPGWGKPRVQVDTVK